MRIELLARDVYFQEFCSSVAGALRLAGCDVHLADSFSGRPYDYHVVVGPHLFPDVPRITSGILVAIQTEQQPVRPTTNSRLLRNQKRFRTIAGYYDAIFDWIPELALQNNRVLIPYGGASREFRHHEQRYEICFIGNIHGNRREQMLHALTPDFQFFPSFSPGFGDAKAAAIQQSKILLNIKFYEDGGFESPRMFDYLSAGAFVISEHTAVTTPFSAGYDFIEFRGEQQLRELLRYYLNHDSARRQIARQGHATSQRYTFAHVAQILLQELAGVQPRGRIQRLWSWGSSRLKCASFQTRDTISQLRRRLQFR